MAIVAHIQYSTSKYTYIKIGTVQLEIFVIIKLSTVGMYADMCPLLYLANSKVSEN
jgi:hypothetical protein